MQQNIKRVMAAALVSLMIAPSGSAAFAQQTHGDETITALPDLDQTAAGEPLLYLSTPEPVISSDVLTIPVGGVSNWMTHPVPAYLYVLQGALTVEFEDGGKQTFRTGQAFLQSRAKWHRGRNESGVPVKFLAVFLGAKGVPTILHPPGSAKMGG